MASSSECDKRMKLTLVRESSEEEEKKKKQQTTKQTTATTKKKHTIDTVTLKQGNTILIHEE